MRHKSPLVWIDLEMTGLNPQVNTIIEIATIITNNHLEIIAYGPHLVIHQPDEILARMDKWNTTTHGASGLTDAVKQSTTTVEEAEKQTLAFIQEYAKANQSVLCGNSVWQDRIFLSKYMPAINQYLNYRIIDVSSIKEVVKRWYPNNPHSKFIKKDNHRALDDIVASIEELRHYRSYFFVNICPEE